jgi:hypothetical protein
LSALSIELVFNALAFLLEKQKNIIKGVSKRATLQLLPFVWDDRLSFLITIGKIQVNEVFIKLLLECILLEY